MLDLVAIVLAAGEGKRMKSRVTKVLHTVAGRPLVYYPVKAALDAGARRVVVVVSPSNREAVEAYLSSTFEREIVGVAVQDVQRGTGDAARVGLEGVEGARVLILYGDTPLLRSDELMRVVAALDEQPDAALSLMACRIDDPAGYGRVLRGHDGRVQQVREDRDLRDDTERGVCEVNAGVYAADIGLLREALSDLKPNNAQREYYLTDVVAFAARRGSAVAVLGDAEALLGVNDRAQLSEAERLMYRRIALRHAKNGVTVRGEVPLIEDSVTLQPDVVIEPNVALRGRTHVGSGTRIDMGCVVTDSIIGSNVSLKPYSVVTASRIGDGAHIGPFAHLRPDSQIGDQARVGNFVETKKTRLGKGAKANHLAYLGDGEIGEGANIGAGTIFCNYDGYAKHTTTIGDGAFIGSDSQLVAPVTIGKGAYVATGTTVTKDVPDEALAIARTRQDNKEGYAPRLRARLAATAKSKK